jgi:hypothetical protein
LAHVVSEPIFDIPRLVEAAGQAPLSSITRETVAKPLLSLPRSSPTTVQFCWFRSSFVLAEPMPQFDYRHGDSGGAFACLCRRLTAARHPHVIRRTPDDVPRLGYTVAVLHEALRLCPPGAAIGRMAMQDIAVDGYRIPRGTMLIGGVYAVHRDPHLWEDPLTFDPDRFSAANSKSRDRWQYLPFGAGPRSCIGDHFAMLEATLALATIVRRTEIHSLRKQRAAGG